MYYEAMDIKFDKEFEEKLAGFFANAFKEVVLPVLKDIDRDLGSMKDDIAQLKEDMVDVKNRLSRVEDRLIKIDDRLDRQSQAQEKLEKRVTHLEEAANFSN
jgi:chromosome segregation ATPase